MPILGSGSNGSNSFSNAQPAHRPAPPASQIVTPQSSNYGIDINAVADDATSAITANVGEKGTIAVTAGDATSAISGTAVPPPISGTLAVTVAGATSTITANVGERGAVAVTVAGATSAITANVGEKGTLAVTVSDATSAVTANVGERGTINVTADDATSAFTGTFTGGGGGGGTDPGHGSLVWPYRPQQRQPAPKRHPLRIIPRRPYAGHLNATAAGATATFTTIFDISQLEDEELLLDLI